MILLTREEAEAVLGPSPTAPESALEPAPLMDGTYVLPEDVIADPANADVEAFLTDHVVPGDPDPALVWDFGTPDNPRRTSRALRGPTSARAKALPEPQEPLGRLPSMCTTRARVR
jgi:hypothetical protein